MLYFLTSCRTELTLQSMYLRSSSRARSAAWRASSAVRWYSADLLVRPAASSSCSRATSSSVLARSAAVAASRLRSVAARWSSSLRSDGWAARSRSLCATDLSISLCSRATRPSVRRCAASIRSRRSRLASSRACERSRASYARLCRPSASVPSFRARSSSCLSRSSDARSRRSAMASRSSDARSRRSAMASRSSAFRSRSSGSRLFAGSLAGQGTRRPRWVSPLPVHVPYP